MTESDFWLRFRERQATKAIHASQVAQVGPRPRPPVQTPNRHPKPVRRARGSKPAKPYMAPLPPALLIECAVRLEAQMQAASGGRAGRPRGIKVKGNYSGPKSEAHREAIAEAMRQRWAAKRGE